MSSLIAPIITFRAGRCDIDQSTKPWKVTPISTPGYIYLYSEDELLHFCWRPRDCEIEDPEIDLVMVPGDGNFTPYNTRDPAQAGAKTNGRIFVLKFTSSSQRHIFWLQSAPQGRSGDPAWLSPRDIRLGEIVDRLLQGEEVDVAYELAEIRNNRLDDPDHDNDQDETMEDVEGHGDSSSHREGGGGGAGPDATGGDFRREGSDAREGGADGARAASNDAAVAVRNFLASLGNAPGLGGTGSQAQGKQYPLLNDLLDSTTTIAMLDRASDEFVDNLLAYLPPIVIVLFHQGEDGDLVEKEPSHAAVNAAKAAMSAGQKRALLKKVLRSPQFSQSLVSLTSALRDGGMPAISEALGISVENGGYVRGGTVPLGGGEAVEAFVEGVKRTVSRS